MKTKIEISDNGMVHMSSVVSMRDFEIAQLLGVHTQTIRANVKAILKSGVCHGDYSHGGTVIGNSITPDYFGLDVVIALAFRVQSPKSEIFRSWMTKKLTVSSSSRTQSMFIQLPNSQIAN